MSIARAVPTPLTPMRTALGFAEDAVLMIGVVACIPVVILAVGAPIALAIRLLLWLTGVD